MVKYIQTTTTKDLGERAWRDLTARMQKNIGQSKIEKTLTALLSPSEKLELTRRLVIISFLEEGKSYKQISRILGVSPQTISAVKKSFSGAQSVPYVPYRKKEKKYKPAPEISYFDEIDKLFSVWPTKSGKGRWRFLNMR